VVGRDSLPTADPSDTGDRRWTVDNGRKPSARLLHATRPVPDVSAMTGAIVDPNYYIETGVSSVTAWSTAQIPFEPKNWLLAFRNDLRSAIGSLPSGGGKILCAAYRSSSHRLADTDNLLVYNIGPAQLASTTRQGLVLRRRYDISRNCPVQLCSPASSQYEYSLVDSESLSIEGQDASLLASLSFDLVASALGHAAAVWYAAKIGCVTLVQRSHVEKPWGISIVINGSPTSRIACSTIVKPLIDGITSALHCHDGSNIDYVAAQLSKNLGLDDDTSMRLLLADGSHALFGRTNLLRPYRNNLKWNSKDEYYPYCLIRCLHDLPSGGLHVDASVFDTSQHESVLPIV
jgi:hypothetical protein